MKNGKVQEGFGAQESINNEYFLYSKPATSFKWGERYTCKKRKNYRLAIKSSWVSNNVMLKWDFLTTHTQWW